MTSPNEDTVYRLDTPDGSNKSVFIEPKQGLKSLASIAVRDDFVAVTFLGDGKLYLYNDAGNCLSIYGGESLEANRLRYLQE